MIKYQGLGLIENVDGILYLNKVFQCSSIAEINTVCAMGLGYVNINIHKAISEIGDRVITLHSSTPTFYGESIYIDGDLKVDPGNYPDTYMVLGLPMYAYFKNKFIKASSFTSSYTAGAGGSSIGADTNLYASMFIENIGPYNSDDVLNVLSSPGGSYQFINYTNIVGDIDSVFSTGPNVREDWIGDTPQMTHKDSKGNIAYGTTLVPLGLHLAYNYEFRGKGSIAYSLINDAKIYCTNCYQKTDGSYDLIDSGRGATIIVETNGERIECTIPSGTSAGFLRNDFITRKINVDGNIAYNGVTIPSDLNASYSYEFRGINSTNTHITAAEDQKCYGCYRDDSGTTQFTALTTSSISVIYNTATGIEFYEKAGTNVIGTSYNISAFTLTTVV